MKKVLFLAVCVLFLAAGAAQADSLYLSNSYNGAIPLDLNGTPWESAGGGSLQGATLNGASLPWVYCVGLTTIVYVPGTYDQTYVNTAGQVYDNDFGPATSLHNVPAAGQVAWLLSNYANGATTAVEQVALQAAIWHVISAAPGGGYQSLGGIVSLDSSSSAYGNSTTPGTYEYDLAQLGANTGTISNFYWMTPGQGSPVAYSQGLVAPVPLPPSLLLLAPGLLGLVGMRKRVKA